jgi:seryl-tRNA synthetase
MSFVPWDTNSPIMNLGASTPSTNNAFGERRSFAIGDIIFEQRSKRPLCGISHCEFERLWATNAGYGDVYKPPFCSLIHTLRAELLQLPFSHFAEMAFPRLLPEEVAERYGLTRAWPEILFSVQALGSARRDLDDHLPRFILDPVQCAPVYAWLEGRTLNTDELPIRIRESLGGWSYRNERQVGQALVRKALEFLRDEYVFIGTSEQVISIRAELVEAFCEFLAKHDFTFRVVIGTGCFREHDLQLAKQLQHITSVSEVPILDIETLIPETGEWLEIVGSSLWGTQLTDAFAIRGDGKLESGCLGIGISRLAYTVLAQRGGKYITMKGNCNK